MAISTFCFHSDISYYYEPAGVVPVACINDSPDPIKI